MLMRDYLHDAIRRLPEDNNSAALRKLNQELQRFVDAMTRRQPSEKQRAELLEFQAARIVRSLKDDDSSKYLKRLNTEVRRFINPIKEAEMFHGVI